MMDDILKQINAGEVSGVQFKERILDKYDIACELVAFSNSHGGKLVVGIKDKTGETNALSYSEVQETTNLLSDIASENVVPSILIKIDTVEVEDGNLVIATVKEGLNKPYHDNKGIVWVKNGADKRKVFDNAELAEMMTDCGSFAPDEAGVRDATVNDLDATTIKQFLGNRFERVLEKKGLTGDAFNEASLDMICSAIAKGHDCEKILRNLRFIRPDGTLTVAAMLLFGKYTQRWMPMMTAKCICFAGNSVGSKVFRDKVNDADMEGNLLHQYDTIMDFFTRNLHNVQVGDEFNSMGKLEIPYTSLVEFTVNSLVHRSLNMKAPVRIFIFDNRVEIHSPGALPNGLTVDDIKAGTSMPRNMFLFNNAIYLLPYTGVGSGITRALDEDIFNILVYTPCIITIAMGIYNIEATHTNRRKMYIVCTCIYVAIIAVFCIGYSNSGSLNIGNWLYAMLVLFGTNVAYCIYMIIIEMRKRKKMLELMTGGDMLPYVRYARASVFALFFSALTMPFVILSTTLLYIIGPLALLSILFFNLSFVALGYNYVPTEELLDKEEEESAAIADEETEYGGASLESSNGQYAEPIGDKENLQSIDFSGCQFSGVTATFYSMDALI